MIYEWRCPQCKMITEAERTVEDRDTPPTRVDGINHKADCSHMPVDALVRILSSPHTNFEHLYDRGVFERVERFPIL
jgi:hypothetical protein